MKQRSIKRLALAALPLAAAAALWSSPESKDFGVHGLRCEYLTNPLGIDVARPRLSWTLNPAPGVRGQDAYRVLAASSPALLEKDQGDLWDSGRVASGQTAWIEYGGKPLGSGQQVYWKVRVWSGGKASPWSGAAFWSMGLLQPSDWRGRGGAAAASAPPTAIKASP